MKKLSVLLVCLLALAGAASAQKYEYKGLRNFPVDSSTHKVSYTGVIEVPGATQAQLYLKTKAWLASHYNSAKAVIQVEDPNNSQLVAQGRLNFRNVATGAPSNYQHMLNFQFKEGKMRYEITDIREGGTPLEQVIPANPVSKKTYDMWWERLNSDFQALTTELRASVTKREASF
ncbi:DUF4468 domain-containing protein [Hymenobacter pini]|uniref:DUF4468 domain-containing protein n=1 Tax=Hymenobacter pini TaxID=2880879 RepID=UPI001CF436F0|nr:DUF4468 domain-containing protein [Hymenobacter pini]MCA8829433.1 DUF4468 domain-containing protein [Hymenobacter pini]